MKKAAIHAAIESIQKNGVTDREVQKAKNGLRAAYVNGFKTNAGRAALVSDYEANWGNWKLLYQYLPRHDKVTAAEVQRVAKKYLTERNRTVVTLYPESPASKQEDTKETKAEEREKK